MLAAGGCSAGEMTKVVTRSRLPLVAVTDRALLSKGVMHLRWLVDSRRGCRSGPNQWRWLLEDGPTS